MLSNNGQDHQHEMIRKTGALLIKYSIFLITGLFNYVQDHVGY